MILHILSLAFFFFFFLYCYFFFFLGGGIGKQIHTTHGAMPADPQFKELHSEQQMPSNEK